MFRIGILGAENSHASAFAKLFNTPDPQQGLLYPDCRVVGIGGHYPEDNQRVFDEFGLEFLASDPAQMLGRVDAVMVTARDGKFHLPMVRPFIEAGIPAFVDKPLTVSEADALELAALVKKTGTPICGGSSVKLAYDVRMLAHTVNTNTGKVRGGSIAAPLNMVNDYSGFYFYASHLAEISLTTFGYAPRAITARRSGNDVTAMVEYDDYIVSNHFLESAYVYHGTVYCNDKISARNIDISLCYRHECDDFVSMLRTGQMAHSLEHLVAPVFYINAIERAYQTGERVELSFPAL